MSQAQQLKPSYYEPIEDQLEALFYELLFAPLVKIVKAASAQGKELLNAQEDILRVALREGRVQYANGLFSGSFNAKLSLALRSIGAQLDKRMGVFKIAPSDVPGWVSGEASAFNVKAKSVHEELGKTLGYIEDTLDDILKQKNIDVSVQVGEITSDFNRISDQFRVMPKLSKQSEQRLAQDYNKNMKLWIEGWAEKEIKQLRGTIEENAMAGLRFDTLIDRIQSRYAVSKSKAKFLARQETALFMAKYRQERFSEGGITHYRWSTARDERVRTSHKHLHGEIFPYNDPPIVDPHTGRRANPGQDFNCRCLDIPLVDHVMAKLRQEA